MDINSGKKQSLHALEATNFFLADVQTGLGPFLAAYLAGAGWEPGRVGMALTIGGIITVVLQAPAGAIVDRLRSKRLILFLASGVLAIGAVLLSITAEPWAVYTSQVLIGGAGPFLGPTLAAVTMGIVGVTFFDRQFGKNQSFNSAGNVACALLIAGMSHFFGNRAIFITAAVLTIPTVLAIRAIRSKDIDYDLARGGATKSGQTKVPLLHCYPSDLKVGGDEVSRLVREYDVRLIDMGHTHYNEIANDGRTLYSATRSTGQIEEGPVGYSVTNIDDNVVSWRFIELGKLPIAAIISPSDERLLTESNETLQETLKVRAKFWGEVEAVDAIAHMDGQTLPMKRVSDSHVWEADIHKPREGAHPLKVSFKDAHGKVASDEIRLAVGQRTERKSEERDQDNALEAWPEHGLLGTQLGPNKNGKKW